jgi:hypothetical protein
VGLAYFYFSYRNKTSIQSVVLALLEQLYLQSSTVATEVQMLEASASNPLERPLAEIISVLISVLGRFRKVYIVLDALDECPSDHRSDLEALISSFQSPHARVLVTTRPSLDLLSLENSPSIDITPSPEDMTLFVTSKMQKIKISREHSPFTDTQEVKIREKLVEKGSQHGV